jgi:hypothetical protein
VAEVARLVGAGFYDETIDAGDRVRAGRFDNLVDAARERCAGLGVVDKRADLVGSVAACFATDSGSGCGNTMIEVAISMRSVRAAM